MKKRRSLTLLMLISVSLLIAGGIWVYFAPDRFETVLQLVQQKIANKPEIKGKTSKIESKQGSSEDSRGINGNDLLRRSRQMMQERIASFSADILQIIQTP